LTKAARDCEKKRPGKGSRREKTPPAARKKKGAAGEITEKSRPATIKNLHQKKTSFRTETSQNFWWKRGLLLYSTDGEKFIRPKKNDRPRASKGKNPAALATLAPEPPSKLKAEKRGGTVDSQGPAREGEPKFKQTENRAQARREKRGFPALS